MENDKQDIAVREHGLKPIVYAIFSDGLMIFLALLMVPIIVLPLLFVLSDTILNTLAVADYAILSIFIAEYVLKLSLASDKKKHFLDSWHLLDLFIVLTPLLDLFAIFESSIITKTPLLRMLRLARIFAVGGRAVGRGITPRAAMLAERTKPLRIRVRVMDKELNNIKDNISLKEMKAYLENKDHTWADISQISEADYGPISAALGIPRIFLESKLTEEAHSRIDYFEHYSMIFAKISGAAAYKDQSDIRSSGVLIICYGSDVITLSKVKSELFEEIMEKAKKSHTPDEPLVVIVLYNLLRYMLDKTEEMITELEGEIFKLENLPFNQLPPDFLEDTFRLKKEVNQLISNMHHFREVLTVITSKRVPLDGFDQRYEKIFGILRDEATYLYETAQNARENLISLIDLYMNTTSHQTNKVMRVIAIITCLAVIPTLIGGLMGMNLIDVPWPVYLWQVVLVIGSAMVWTTWVFYKLGWFKS